jgi:Flp pilus assembly protein TadG
MDIKKSLFPLKKGQALVELALGMFALALVLSAIFSFTRYIVTSLDVQRKARVKAGVAAFSAGAAENDSAVATESQKVNVEKMSAEYIFGREEVDVKERVVIPGLGGLK